jgi:hypothetical protein
LPLVGVGTSFVKGIELTDDGQIVCDLRARTLAPAHLDPRSAIAATRA